MEAVSAVEAAFAMDAAASLDGEPTAAVKAVYRRDRPSAKSGPTARCGMRPVHGAAREAGAAVIGMREPRASADEEAAGKPVWTVVPVRCARVWVVSIVSIDANRRRAGVRRSVNPAVNRTDSDAYRKSLSMRERRGAQENTNQSKNS